MLEMRKQVIGRLLTDVVVESNQFAREFCFLSVSSLSSLASKHTFSAIHDDPDLRTNALVDEFCSSQRPTRSSCEISSPSGNRFSSDMMA